MNDLATITGPGIEVAQATVATIATILAIGVAFLVSPSRATLLWSMGFSLAMVSSYGMVAGVLGGVEPIRWVSAGLLMGAPALLWSGFRALRGVRTFSWIAPIVSVVSAAVLLAAGGSTWDAPGARAVFLTTSLFGALFLVEWRRLPQRRDPLLWPLAAVSFLLVAAGVVGIAGVTGVAGGLWPSVTERLPPSALPLAASIVVVVYVAAAVLAVLAVSARGWLRRARSRTSADAAWQRFEESAGERLARAQRSAQPWSVIYLELDDVTEIRQIFGSAVLAQLTERFGDAVRRAFPEESEMGMPHPGCAVLAVPRPDAAIRQLLRDALQEISGLDTHGRMPVQPSASIGWAPASTSGYDLGSLIYFSREAAAQARQHGGDRWERVGPAVIERLLSGPGRP